MNCSSQSHFSYKEHIGLGLRNLTELGPHFPQECESKLGLMSEGHEKYDCEQGT